MGKLQNEDHKSLTELLASSGSASQLLNDTKIYVTANSINKQLSQAITDGDIGGGGGTASGITDLNGFKAVLGGSFNVTSSAETDVVFTDVSSQVLRGAFDRSNGAYDTGTGYYTAPADAVYHFEANGVLGSAIAERFTLRIRDVDTNNALSSLANLQGGSGQGLTLSGLVELTTGQRIKLTVDSTSDTSYSLQAGSFFSVVRVPEAAESVVSATDNVAPARYLTTAGQSIPNNVTTVVDFDTQSWDDDGLVTTGASWNYEVPVDAYYRATAQIVYTNSSANFNQVTLTLHVDGVRVSELGSQTNKTMDTDSGRLPLNGSDVIFCTAGQLIDVRTFQTSGGNLALNTSSARNYINIERVDKSAIAELPIVQSCLIQDVKALNTAGGTSTAGGFATRDINEITGGSGFCSLSSNQFTLQPGTYKITARSPSYRSNGGKARIRDVTNSATIQFGSSGRSGNTDITQYDSWIYVPELVVTSAASYELQFQVETSRSTDGLGRPGGFGGGEEVYTQVWIDKLK